MSKKYSSATIFVSVLNFVFFALLTDAAQASTVLSLRVAMQTTAHSIHGSAKFQFDSARSELAIQLHPHLRVAQNAKYKIRPLGLDGLAQSYVLELEQPNREIEIEYEGVIDEPIVDGQTPGSIRDQGIQLLSESYWYPAINENFNYSVEVELPNRDWNAILPGILEKDEPGLVKYKSFHPSGELALIADRYHGYETKTTKGVLVRVWLRSEDPNLAQQYLNLVPQYLERYSGSIGPFPYPVYSVVENSLETGYALPGFTLLGPSVIRLPFILRSSLPHEILHSWWGNSVMVDYAKGNWCEGLTTHQADHAFRIEEGKGAEYRRSTLQAYQDFVSSQKDFPVRKFIGRHDRGTQAVGYGKTMMIFQMLENYIGLDHFQRALSDFFKINVNQAVGFFELEGAFEKEVGSSLKAFFGPWLDQTGAPELVVHQPQKNGNQLTLLLEQNQAGNPSNYVLPVRAKVTLLDGTEESFLMILDSPKLAIQKTFNQEPKKLQIDPEYEVFRRLYPEETPPALSQVLADEEQIFISVPAGQKLKYGEWTRGLSSLYSKTPQILEDTEPLPGKGAIWLVGAENLHAKALAAGLSEHGLQIEKDQVTYGNHLWKSGKSTVVITERVKTLAVAWIWTSPQEPAGSLAQKISHYTSFSLVGFTGGKNDLKETWKVLRSPLIFDLTAKL